MQGITSTSTSRKSILTTEVEVKVELEMEMEMEIRSWGEEACAERDLDPASVIGSHTGTLLTRVHST